MADTSTSVKDNWGSEITGTVADTSTSVKDNWGSEITGTVIERDLTGNPTKIVNSNGTYKKDSWSVHGTFVRED